MSGPETTIYNYLRYGGGGNLTVAVEEELSQSSEWRVVQRNPRVRRSCTLRSDRPKYSHPTRRYCKRRLQVDKAVQGIEEINIM